MNNDSNSRLPQAAPASPTSPRLQLPPVLFRPDGNTAFLANLYRGHSAFLVCSGPSLASHDLAKLHQRGVLTCSVNNAAAIVRSHLWVSVDRPGNFCDTIWHDPGIHKFIPLSYMDTTIRVRDADGKLVDCVDKVREMPAVFGLRLSSGFRADRFLREPTFTWGNQGSETDDRGNTGVRSVLFVALKLLFVLGIRRVYLLGCDFRMSYGDQNYAFTQHRTRSSVRGNNHSYRVLSVRLADLKPCFEEAGYEIYNCTPGSGLTVFPHVDYEQAVTTVTQAISQDIRTEGMYDPRRKGEPAMDG